MIEFKGAAALGGYVRAVFSGRLAGHVVPVDLLRAQAKTAAMVARVRCAFADYLVSDGEPCADDAALRALEVAPAFSPRRAFHSGFHDVLTATTDGEPIDSRYRVTAGGPLDAPGCVPAGACDALGALFGGSPQVVALREPIERDMEAPAFTERRAHWVEHVETMPRHFGTGSHVERIEECRALRAGFDGGSLDAPMFVPGGAARWRGEAHDGFVGSALVLRAGYWQ